MGKNTWLIKTFLKARWKEKWKMLKGFLFGEKKYLEIPDGEPHVDMKELVRCALCPNMCKFECPSLRVTKKEMYAPSTKSRISFFMEKGYLDSSNPHTAEVPYLCTNCDGCRHWCPMGISTGDLLKDVRADLVERGHVSSTLKEFNKRVQKEKTTFNRDTFKKPGFSVNTPGADTFYYMGCVMAEKKPDAVKANIVILKKAGVLFSTHVRYRVCCGGPLFTAGFRDTAKSLAKENLDLFEKAGISTVVADCPACTDAIRTKYKELGLDHDLEVYNTTEYYANLIKEGRLVPTKPVNMIIAFHDPCIIARGFDDTESARYIFSKIPGLEVREPFLHGKETQCCGMGGVSHVHHPHESEAIGMQRYMQLKDTGADYLVSACPACEEGFSIAGTNAEMEDDRRKLVILDIGEILVSSLE
ncbi:hypothetical protein GF325_14765 [Candidatus Bathyarchaeota archaeon]|nr:hypothetical protein [Candidatus Bathyarchaeota archaeon]